MVDRDEVVASEEEVDVLCCEASLMLLHHDAVQNQIQEPVVTLDFRMVNLRERVFNRELVEMKRLAEQPRLVGTRRLDVDPKRLRCTWRKPGRIDAIRPACLTRLVDEDDDHAAAGRRRQYADARIAPAPVPVPV